MEEGSFCQELAPSESMAIEPSNGKGVAEVPRRESRPTGCPRDAKGKFRLVSDRPRRIFLEKKAFINFLHSWI